MRKSALAVTVGMIAAACNPPSNVASNPTRTITDRITEEETADAPERGRDAGLHEYDGKIGDYSAAGIQRQIHMLEAHIRQLEDAGWGSPDDKLDVALLKWQAEEALFWLRDAKSPERDPAFYSELFSVSGYLDRNYAPLEDRFRHLVEHEEAALGQVGWVRANLKPPLPKPLVDVAIGIYEGYAEYLRGDVVKLTAEANDQAVRARFSNANEALAKEADGLASWLKTVPTDSNYALGPKRFERLVEIYAGEKMPLAEFERVGEADLAQNQAAYNALADVQPVKVTDALTAAAKLTAEARQFIIDHRIVTMPRSDLAEVKETPPFLRYNFAWLNAGGPYELSTGANFYVTPPDPAWPEAQREAYIPPLGELRSTCVHEVYPGHFIQAGFLRQAPTRVQKMVGSSTFIEGWAHYAEQMMVEQGFGADPEGKRGEVTQALLRDCRYLVALRMHTRGMTIDQAEKFMVDACHQTVPVAKQQALRGAFHPWYFAYTLGKLQILKLRAEAQQRLGGAFDLRAFHDALLQHGQGPIGLIHDRVLAQLTAPP